MKITVALLLVFSMLTLVGCQHAPEATPAEETPQAGVHAPAGEDRMPADASSANTEAGQEITREAAEKIALDHAGLTADAVTRLHTEYDRERISHYDVEFHHERYEYSYEIHAETGEILDFEKEIDN